MHLSVDAILFDLDGTLIDSTASVERSWRLLADHIGIDYDSLNGSHHGVPSRQTLNRLLSGRPDSEIAEVDAWLAEVEVADLDGVVPLPGAIDVLTSLPPDRWAIVTSGTVRLATTRIAAAGLPMPTQLITSNDVTEGKPSPEPYILGAHRLGFEPKRCLVVEDAPAGVASGLASGATVLGLRTTHSELGVPAVCDLTEITLVVTPDGIEVWQQKSPRR